MLDGEELFAYRRGGADLVDLLDDAEIERLLREWEGSSGDD